MLYVDFGEGGGKLGPELLCKAILVPKGVVASL